MTNRNSTDVKLSEFMNKPIVNIVEVDADNKQINDKPIISFGKRKLKAILDNFDKLQKAYDKMKD